MSPIDAACIDAAELISQADSLLMCHGCFAKNCQGLI